MNKKDIILKVGKELFIKEGYGTTSINKIVKKAGIAKGTFYLYFKSKEDLLLQIVDNILNGILEDGKNLFLNNDLTSKDKLKYILGGLSNNSKEAEDFSKILSLPENRILHERINKELVLKLPEIIVNILEKGKKDGEINYRLDRYNLLNIIQFITAGGQFLFDEGLFNWSKKETLEKKEIMVNLLEESIGLDKGYFNFLIR